ncbi:DUF397 domain-containing protein [Amycolatopsis cihanbeyliensis]|uniref:Uncharacterized protein DUF397 n=1 Tax=Amycolatopsis cihanbeyliensis TaxID=1128664 RepID=A0A542DL15_AMYCI|nr:DUF397 domain-containing protein [Amycolatopsis cihanbeyliensis]TQJ03787.1 uncharacterized protein DUF397 [Amycolatopsis cihanbeyliensis]
MTPDQNTQRWRRSSYSSGQGGQCVELSHALSAIRDSKDRAAGALDLSPTAFRAFLRQVREG